MAYEQFDTDEAAKYLNMSIQELEKLVRSKEIPSRISQNRLVFVKAELHDWMTTRFLSEKDSPADFHKNKGKCDKPLPKDQPFLEPFLLEQTIELNFQARTKPKVLKGLVKIAAESHLISDEQEYLELLIAREEIGSTGIVKGVAMPHSRVHDEFLLLDSFLVIAYSRSGIPFGAQDGKLSDLFIMPCAQGDTVHLQLLARIALLLSKTSMADEIRQCTSPAEVIELIVDIEKAYLNSIK